MLDVIDFYNDDASEKWFTTKYLKASIHAQLESNGHTIVDRLTLDSRYPELKAPVTTINLSYADKISTPLPGLVTTFILGRAQNLKTTEQNGIQIGDLLTDWMQSMPGKQRYLMSLNPTSYLFTKSNSVTFDDILNVTRTWGIDCLIGVFDETQKVMFVFAEEFGVVYACFDSSIIPDKFGLVSDIFSDVVARGFAQEISNKTSGDSARLEEYYRSIIEPHN